MGEALGMIETRGRTGRKPRANEKGSSTTRSGGQRSRATGRRNRYDNAALLDERGGRYYRNGGVFWPAIIAQVVGMVAAALWLNAYSPYVSPLSSRIGGSDFSVFMGALFGAGVYYLLNRRSARAEAAASTADYDEDWLVQMAG